MADTTINGLASELLVAGANDLVMIWDVANSITKKIKRSNLVGASITGGGTIALGGFTFTVPASGTPALLDRIQNFTVLQGFAPALVASNAIGIVMPVSTAGLALKVEYTTTRRTYINVTAAATQIGLDSDDYGATIGPSLLIGHNSNAAASAAGNIRMKNKLGTEYYVYMSGALLRNGTTAPVSASDTANGAVGDQTSTRASKDVIEEFEDYPAALAAIVAAPLYRFTYKDGRYDSQEFVGIITDESPVFGKDRDPDHPQGKALNEITAHGYEMAAIKMLWAEIVALKAEVARLKH